MHIRLQPQTFTAIGYINDFIEGSNLLIISLYSLLIFVFDEVIEKLMDVGFEVDLQFALD